jgi:methionyl-tRNA synthetase
MSKRFYLTTAIDYVNGQPHLGHAYEKVITDVIARAHRALGEEVFFLTGLDEHGQKVQQAAQAMGKTPQAYCDDLAKDWQNFVTKLGLSNNEFIRTTQPRHKQWVQTVLSRLHAQGDFYRAEHHGFYSVKEETFLTDKDRLPDGTFDPSWGEVIELTEENYYFKLGKYQQWLIDHVEANPNFVAPGYRRNEVLGFLKNNKLEDLCCTRPTARLNWGIPLPFDDQYVTYVWFDALSNYASLPGALGDPLVVKTLGLPQAPTGPELWPADIHVVGKDIIKFHAVYWPIMLKAMGLPLPKQVLVHGWWQKDGAKIAKSTGNIVEPIAVINEWGLDAFRFYVVRELAIGPDGNWTDAGFASRYNAELANGLGNLLNRSLTMIKKYRQSVVPARHDELAPDATVVLEKVTALLRQNELQDALVAIWSLVTRANQYIEQTAPFKLARESARLDEVLYNLIECCRVLGILIAPFLPGTAERIFAQLNLGPVPPLLREAQWGKLSAGHKVGDPVPLFPRKDQPAK